MRLQPLGGVVVEGELEVEGMAASGDLPQMRQQGPGIFAPEDEDARRVQRDGADLSAVAGIAPQRR